VKDLGYAAYFLTVHDIVRFARRRGILCQGRGSAANSSVCFCLGITEVDPTKHDLLFERFISAERREPPDIDVDFEHERREEVMQYIYTRYGRGRAGLTATVISYRSRSSTREVAKVDGIHAYLKWADTVAKAAQQEAAAELTELARRLEKVQTPMFERLRAYEARIGELERDLADQSKENRELLKLKIDLLREKIETERTANRIVNFN
jgi:DNA polymerase III alpha subunit